MQHGDAVGAGLLEHLREGHGSAVHRSRRGGADVMVLARQHRCRCRPAPDVHGRHQLANVAPCPAQLGEAAERAVLEGDGAVFRWREALHPAECLGIGFGGGCGRLTRGGGGGHGHWTPEANDGVSYHGDTWRTSNVCAEVTVAARLALTVSCAPPIVRAICVKRPRKGALNKTLARGFYLLNPPTLIARRKKSHAS